MLDQMASVPHDEASVSWMLDRSSFELLAEALNSGNIPPELAEVLTRYAGEPGRHAGAVDEVLHEGGSRLISPRGSSPRILCSLRTHRPGHASAHSNGSQQSAKRRPATIRSRRARERHAALDKALVGTNAANK